MKKLKLLLSAALVTLFGAGIGTAQATEQIARELNAYKDSTVIFVSNSKKDCNIPKKAADYKAHLDSQLASLGINNNADSGLAAVLLISHESFAILGSLCAVHVDLSFQTRIPKEMFTRLTEGQKAALERIDSLPVSLWTASAMSVVTLTQPSAGGGESVDGQKAVIRLIDSIIDLLRKQRT